MLTKYNYFMSSEPGYVDSLFPAASKESKRREATSVVSSTCRKVIENFAFRPLADLISTKCVLPAVKWNSEGERIELKVIDEEDGRLAEVDANHPIESLRSKKVIGELIFYPNGTDGIVALTIDLYGYRLDGPQILDFERNELSIEQLEGLNRDIIRYGELIEAELKEWQA